MDYCEKHGFPPAQSWAWDKAAVAYQAAQELILCEVQLNQYILEE